MQQGAAPATDIQRAPIVAPAPAAPDVAREALPVAEIKRDVDDGVKTHTDLFSWLHVMGNRKGEIGHPAKHPKGTDTKKKSATWPKADAKPAVDKTLPIQAHFFPSWMRHTDQRALIVGGFHGDERPGYEMVDAFVKELDAGGPKDGRLAFHTLIVPRLNLGAITDDLAGVTTYDRRCNRQLVDLNRNLPVPGKKKGSPDCRNSGKAPTQPEVTALVQVIKDFQPHRILTAHAIGTAGHAGVFADKNDDPAATKLACELAWLLPDADDRKHNKLKGDQCNPIYHGDTKGKLPSSASLGAFGPSQKPPIPVVTVEAPTYKSLGTTGTTRSVEAYQRVLRGFVTDPAQLAERADLDIVRDIQALALPQRRMFLTGRLQGKDALYARVRARLQRAEAKLNALKPPKKVKIVSHTRLFSKSFGGSSGQAKILFQKLLLTGSRKHGWDSLPDKFFKSGNRKKGVDRVGWLKLPVAARLKEILKYTAVPGGSRHHWGTDVDFNSTANADWAPAKGSKPAGKLHALGVWLQANAPKVGFRQAYTPGRTGGHHEEAWHYSYAPIAEPLRKMHNKDVRLEQDIVDPLMVDFAGRAKKAAVKLPSDLRSGLLGINLSSFVDDIGPGL